MMLGDVLPQQFSTIVMVTQSGPEVYIGKQLQIIDCWQKQLRIFNDRLREQIILLEITQSLL